eukprot:3920528-Rhodomonas_salina.4
MVLRLCYVLCGTDTGYGPTRSSTKFLLEAKTEFLRAVCSYEPATHSLSGADLAYAATQSPVLTSRMLLPGAPRGRFRSAMPLRPCYQLSAMLLSPCYQLSGTDVAYELRAVWY